jgi:hypothetical protein
MTNASQTIHKHLYKYAIAMFMIAAACIFVNQASANSPRENKETVNLPDLKLFEGYYQFDQDPEIYVQILVRNDQLILKQLWDKKEITFTRHSDLEFSDNGNFSLVFSKNPSGKISSLLAFGRDKWNRVANYHPIVKKAITLSAEQLAAFTGTYKLKNNKDDLFIKFSVQGKYLVAKEMWSGKEIIVVPESADTFFGKDQRYPLYFKRDASGKVQSAIIFKKDVWEKTD